MNMVHSNGIIIRSEIIKSIVDSRNSIQIAMAYFNDREIFEQIKIAASRGVKIDIIIADEVINNTIIELYNQNETPNLSLYIRTIFGRGVMHHKFCIIDTSIILKGSYNYTYSASKNNDENLEISTDNNVIADYINIFNETKAQSSLVNPSTRNSMQEIDPQKNEIEQYSNKLQNLISDLIDKFDSAEIVNQAFENSKINHGDPAQFVNGLDLILNKYKIEIQQDASTRSQIKLRIEAALSEKIKQLNESLKAALKSCKEEYDFMKKEVDIVIKQLKGKFELLKLEKNNEEVNLKKEKGELEFIHTEINTLNTKIGVIPFTFKNTWYNFAFLAILFIYLFVFYSSAIYNLVYVAKEAERASSIGGDLPKVEFFNSKAIGNLIKSGFTDMIFNFMAVFIPLGLAISKLYTKNKYVQFILGWIVAVLIVDFFVAVSISMTIAKVESMRLGEVNNWTLASSFSNIEFWKVFIFGAIPLIMFKLIVELIYTKWMESQPHIINREKSIEIKLLKQNALLIEQKIHGLEFSISSIDSKIESTNKEMQEFEVKMNTINGEEVSSLSKIEYDYTDRTNSVKQITENLSNVSIKWTKKGLN